MNRQRVSLTPRSRGLVALVLVAVALLLVAVPAQAAGDRYDRARRLAFSGERQAARELLTELLAERPNHWDARILLGRLYAWDKRFDEAREQLLAVVRAKPHYADAISALLDVEIWSKNWRRALEVADQGLAQRPTDQEFLYRKALVQKKLGDLGAAAVTLDRLNDINPGHERGSSLYRNLRVARARHKIGVSYGFTELDTLANPWHTGSFQLTSRTAIGSVILRANYANRFRKSAKQFELDAYPKLANGVYMFVNYGYSQDSLYPRHRYAAEMYTNFGGGFELSAGFRRLEFAGSEVTIYTGTIAKYQGSWWLSFRPYITPKSEGTSRSYQLTVRRYLGNADSFIGVFGGLGSSPSGISDLTDLQRRDSWKVGARLDKTLGDMFILKLSARYGWEQLFAGRDRRQFSVGIGFERRF